MHNASHRKTCRMSFATWADIAEHLACDKSTSHVSLVELKSRKRLRCARSPRQFEGVRPGTASYLHATPSCKRRTTTHDARLLESRRTKPATKVIGGMMPSLLTCKGPWFARRRQGSEPCLHWCNSPTARERACTWRTLVL